MQIYFKSIHDFKCYIILQVTGALRVNIIRFFEKCCSTFINEYNSKVYASTCSLVYVGWYCWVMNPLMSNVDIILSTLKGRTHCCEWSSFNENTGHQKIWVLYRDTAHYNWTPLCINYLCTAISHNTMLYATTCTYTTQSTASTLFTKLVGSKNYAFLYTKLYEDQSLFSWGPYYLDLTISTLLPYDFSHYKCASLITLDSYFVTEYDVCCVRTMQVSTRAHIVLIHA
jgi:hypothetical protein